MLNYARALFWTVVYCFTDDDVTDRCVFCGKPCPSVCNGKCRR